MGMLSVRVGGEVKYEHAMGYADLEDGIPFTKDSLFTFYSLSKPFCAIGLLKLYDKGLVDLDAHPSKYVPECQDFDPEVTLHNMLNHTSGLPDFLAIDEFVEKYRPGTVEKTREHLKLLSKYPQYFKPGSDGMYANINFTVCALIIENVSGMPYHEYMQKEVFEPLGMKNAFVYYEGRSMPRLVSGYELSEGGELRKIAPSRDWMFGGGDIIGTVDDVYKLNLAIKHGLMLEEETWKKVLTPSPINTFGYGCFVVEWHGKKRINHNGGHTGFRTLHVLLPEDDFDIIFLSNSGFGKARADIAEIVYSEFYGADTIDEIKTEMDKGYI